MAAMRSPLFEPVRWLGDGFTILDETLLPREIRYINVTDVRQAVAAVREMRTRAFGQVLTFLYSGALLAGRYASTDPSRLREQLAAMTNEFCAARPTFDFSGLGDFFENWLVASSADATPGSWISQKALEFASNIVCARDARAQRAASLLPASANVLTHCNVSGELVAVAQHCRRLGKSFTVVTTETRPYLQGTRLTAWELAQAGVPVSLIPDCAIAQVMSKGVIDAVIVGSDRTAQNGDIINKVGTYPLAVMAREFGIPFFALVQEPRTLLRGNDVSIEERPASELLSFHGQQLIANDQITVRYPAFDVTPAEMISRLIGFDAIYTADRFKEKYQKAPAEESEPLRPAENYLLVYGVPQDNQYKYLRSALKAEGASSVLVPEMRPQLYGAKVVAPGLLRHSTPTTLISDNMMGTLFAHGEVRKLCIYYAAVDEHGPRGICGSLLAVHLARLHGVPIELLAADRATDPTVDRDISTFLGINVCPDKVSIFPIEQELIPWALFKDPADNSR
jgi:methylthioribose-1-phosphate isomerase